MKKLFTVSSAFLILFVTQSLMIMKKDGAEPGYTGSPGDGYKNCTHCHGGEAHTIDGWLNSDIPSSGYIPGVTYTITATNRDFGATRFGFQVSPQDSSGNLLGTIIVTDSLRTKLVGGTKYITYTENGVEGRDSLAWSFKWKAPDKLIKNVVFYGAFNSNFEGHKGGDVTYLSSLKVKKNEFISLNNLNTKPEIKVYPNPTFNYVQIELDIKEKGNLIAEIIDINGRQVSLLIDETMDAGPYNKQFDIRNIADGNYFIRINLNGEISTHNISVVR